MSQVLIYLLLALALVIPVLGTIALRLLGERLSEAQMLWSATALFGIALCSVLVLAFGNISSLTIGNVTVLLPLTNPINDPQPAPRLVEPADLPSVDVSPTVAVAETDRPEATPAQTATRVPRPTRTATPEVTSPPPTDTPTLEPASPTAEPASPTPEAPPEPPPPQTYTVAAGDTLRGIAAQFDVSVEELLAANNLTPAEADSLRPGQDLIIP